MYWSTCSPIAGSHFIDMVRRNALLNSSCSNNFHMKSYRVTTKSNDCMRASYRLPVNMNKRRFFLELTFMNFAEQQLINLIVCLQCFD